MFAVGYYGLLRVGEMTVGDHTIKAKDVHFGNKDNFKLILHSSKTHGKESRLQQIKIRTNPEYSKIKLFFCPVQLMYQYLQLPGGFDTWSEQLFIFRDSSPVQPQHLRKVLHDALDAIGLDSTLYNVQSLRIGRASDLVHKFHYTVEEVKFAGHWKSNAVYKYIKYP